MRPLLLLPPAIFASLGTLFFLGVRGGDGDALPTAFAGRPAPAITAAPLGTGPTASGALLGDGTPRLVNFWASWCAPCREEHPVLDRLAREGVEIVGINHKDLPENALAFLEELGNPYAALGADRTGRTGVDWGVYGVPETFVVDGRGVILARIAGPISERDAATVLAPLLGR